MGKNKLFAGLPDGLPDDEPQQETTQLPQELQGKSTAEVYETLRAENERLLNEQEQRLKAQAFDESKKAAPQQTAPSYAPPPPNYAAYTGVQNQKEPDIYSDPEGFMDRQLERRMGPVVQQTFYSLKESNKNQFIARVGQEEWAKYGAEIEQFIGGLSGQAQIMPEAYNTAYNFVRSTHLDEITQTKAEQLAEQRVSERLEALGIDPRLAAGTEGTVEERIQQAADEQADRNRYKNVSLFQPDTGTVPPPMGGRSSVQQKSASRGKLTNDERAMAEAFGMSDTEYLEYKKLNTDVVSEMRRS